MPATPTTRTGNAPTDELRAFLDRDWERWLSEAPEIATLVGRTDFDDRWTDDSPEGIGARRHHLEAAWEELRRFDEASLDRAGRLDLLLYRDLLGTARQGLEFHLEPLPFRFGAPRHLGMPMNQLDGIQITAPDLLRMQPRERPSDYAVLLRRLERLPTAVRQTQGLLKEGLAHGWTPPRVAVRSLPDQVRDLVPADPRASELFEPFAAIPTPWPAPQRAEIVGTMRSLYDEGVRPAFLELEHFLRETYLPQCRTEVAASALPDGAAWYRFLVARETTTSLTPEAIHRIGLDEVRRVRDEMEKVRSDAGFSGSHEEFLRFLGTDPRFVHASPEALLSGYRSLAKRIDPELAHQFGRLPRLPYGVRPIPEHRAPSSPTAYYYSGASATGRPGYFYINTFDLPARPSWEMEALTLHEAVPGHHLQLALMEELEQLPAFRRYSGYTAFVEGWGLYAEGLGADLGLYRDPYSRFGRLSMDAWRSARLVVDTGMHALGWSRDRAIEFLRKATGKSDTDIVAEVDRYIVWPGQALAYKVGELKLRELRAEAEERLGSKFDVRAFHDSLLAAGGLPLGALADAVHEWLDERSTPAP